MRCTASWARTARGSPPPSGYCSGSCARTPGTVRLLDGDPWRDAVDLHRRLAYVPGDVDAVAEPHRRRGDRPARPAARRPGPGAAGDLLERFDLDPRRRAAAYSKGNRQKVGPGRGAGVRRRAAGPRRADVGPRSADGGRVPGRASGEVRGRGRTVLLSSHILAEVEALCDRVSIIRHGRTVQSGSLTETATPDPHVDHGRDRAPGDRAPAAAPACTTSFSRTAARGSTVDSDTSAAPCST